MGCSSSKSLGRKRRGTEYSVPQKGMISGMSKSWYAPVSRTVSAPINYQNVSEEEDDDDEGKKAKDRYHAAPLASSKSSYGFLKLNDKRNTLVSQFHGNRKPFRSELNPVIEEEQHQGEEYKGEINHHGIDSNDDDGMETINAWELMEGLDDDEGGGAGGGEALNVERSLTLDRLDSYVHDSDASLWKPCNDFKTQHSMMPHHHHHHRRFKSCEGLEEVEEEEEEVFSYSCMKKFVSSSPLVRTPPRSPMRMWPTRTTGHRSPRSPLLRSPSLLGSDSPLFDPTLLAKFEKALQNVTPDRTDWLLVNELYGATRSISTDLSSFSSHNRTSLSYTSTSASSSGNESPQFEVKCKPHGSPNPQVMKREKVNIMSPIPKCSSPLTCDEELDISEFSYGLEHFELRCPPRGEHKVVLYFTSLRGVRKTFQDCCHVKLILQGLRVDVDERDVWMHSKFREELTELLGNKRLQVPRLFVKGRYIGGIEDVSQLHEDGILVGLFEGLPSFGIHREVCRGCDGVRFVPCLTCNGSCKIMKDLGRTTRCEKCNENGLIMCPICSNT